MKPSLAGSPPCNSPPIMPWPTSPWPSYALGAGRTRSADAQPAFSGKPRTASVHYILPLNSRVSPRSTQSAGREKMPPKSRKEPCPECGKLVSVRDEICPFCDADLFEEEDDRPRRRGEAPAG